MSSGICIAFDRKRNLSCPSVRRQHSLFLLQDARSLPHLQEERLRRGGEEGPRPELAQGLLLLLRLPQDARLYQRVRARRQDLLRNLL